MGFVQTGFLAALAAVAIPIAIHLIYRRRTRRVELGTLRFLKVVLKENARRRKVKRWLLLSLRTACVALLAVLFARPYLNATKFIDSGDRFVVVLIDRSASMQLENEGRPLLDRAAEEAEQILKRQGEKTEVAVAFFDHAVHPVELDDALASRGREPAGTNPEAYASGSPVYGATDYGAALAWARDACVNSGKAKQQIHLFTDLQRSGLDFGGAEPIPSGVGLHVHDVGRDLVNNVALSGARVANSLIRPGENTSLVITVFNSGELAVGDIPVLVELQTGARRHTLSDRLSVEAHSTATATFQLPELTAGLWRGTVTIDVEDDLAFDNRQYVAVMAAPQKSVLLVDGDPRESRLLSETFYLEAALRLAPPGEVHPDSPFAPTTKTQADALASEFDRRRSDSSADLVVLANVGRITESEAARLARFVEEGGGLLVFTGENVHADGYGALADAGLTPGTIGEPVAANDLPWRLQSWEKKHPVLLPFADPQHGDLRRLAFESYTKITPHDEAQVLARFRGGDPALIERRHGSGRVLWFTTACDRQWGNWTESRLYLPLVHQMLAYLSGLTEGGPVRHTTIDGTGDSATQRAPGVYEQPGYWEVVNASPRESETQRCSREELAERFGVAARADADAPASSNNRGKVAAAGSLELRDDEIWHWAALLLLGVLLTEFFVANRTAA